MGLRQQPKCKDKTCRFCDGKYCTILKQKPDVCRFYKAKEIMNDDRIEEQQAKINKLEKARQKQAECYFGRQLKITIREVKE